MDLVLRWCGYLLVVVWLSAKESHGECTVPAVMRGTWFSFELGSNTITDIDATSMSRHGQCVALKVYRYDHKALLFKNNECYYCVRFHIRTVNILEKSATECNSYKQGYKPSLDEVCAELEKHQTLVTMFNENYVPKNCRSAIEGVWHFAYQNRFSFTGECNHGEAKIQSCQEPGNQFLIANQKFNITFKKCEGIKESFDGTREFSCLGDWFVGKNHFFAVANTKESRKDEKYRCFVRNRDDDLYMGHSITPECSVLQTPENSPFRFRMTPVKQETVNPGCLLPKNFSGDWMNTAHMEADVFINQTHIIETTYPDEGRYRRTIYVCREQRDNRYMMARLNIDGCQKDYVCFEFVPRHHNIIRFRKGLEMIREDFSTVCSYIQFKSGREQKREWNYNLMLSRDPVSVKCPVAGKFNFTQKGELLFETRILGGVTKAPWDNIYCRENISDLSVCDQDQKEIWIDAHYCISVDAYGRHMDIYTDPDYKLKCIGYWKENLQSYLITYDELDPFSKYRCWVYQRADLNKVLMSQSVGPFCNLKQTVLGTGNGAAVTLNMVEYEREHDRCPMYFDDGSNPWQDPGADVHVFEFTAGSHLPSPTPLLAPLTATFILLCRWLL
ncbi:hypothetical protein Pcinc_017136 [Petrolisthes cinctipes]|uniref:Uncharacterized protein n=1 Tax=Petrolisthes cinctipes TaxID=88211 RepID=A0AAE1KNU1_PETCI|nr:hypothetical protein Pcinc_042204 [Petrolisthes cinctipes]KAK3878213.1 hypothetical protein Pcinc_017136 [Petrolisthes cinctipes]